MAGRAGSKKEMDVGTPSEARAAALSEMFAYQPTSTAGGLRYRAHNTTVLWERLPEELIVRIVLLARSTLPFVMRLERRCWQAGRERLQSLAPLYRTPFIFPMTWIFGDHAAQILGLSQRQLDDHAIDTLSKGFAAGAMPFTTLLDLSNNRFGDIGGKALAHAVARAESDPLLPRLRTLLLMGNAIGVAAQQALADALAHGALPALKELSIDRASAELQAACSARRIRVCLPLRTDEVRSGS